MSPQNETLLLVLAFIGVGFLALHFGLVTVSLKSRLEKLEAENKRLKKEPRGGQSPASRSSYDAIIAAFIFGMISADSAANSDPSEHDLAADDADPDPIGSTTEDTTTTTMSSTP